MISIKGQVSWVAKIEEMMEFSDGVDVRRENPRLCKIVPLRVQTGDNCDCSVGEMFGIPLSVSWQRRLCFLLWKNTVVVFQGLDLVTEVAGVTQLRCRWST